MASRNQRGRARSFERAERAEIPETISWWRAFYRVVRRIPVGRVCTYGAVAAMAGHPRAARHVGHALAALKETGEKAGVPWHRVLGSRPRRRAAISIKDPVGAALQRALLEAEGVEMDQRGDISLDRFGWFRSPPAAAPAGKKGAAPAGKKRAASAGKKRAASAGKKRAASAGKKRAASAGKKRAASAGKKRAASAGKKRAASAGRSV